MNEQPGGAGAQAGAEASSANATDEVQDAEIVEETK
jgi:hypothetical protein